MDGKISIIIPIYNAELYLNRCLSSVCMQTYTNLEIILVNDGSSDDSEEICLDFKKRDKRIKYFYQKNQGVSEARNYGLRMATGDYVTFVDSDDWIDTKAYEIIMSSPNNIDIVFNDAIETDGLTVSHSNTYDLEAGTLNYEDITEKNLEELAGAVWRAIYKKEIIKGIYFPMNLPLSEDKVFCLQCLAKADKIYYTKKSVYYRYERNDSAVNMYRKDMFDVQLRAYIELKKIINRDWSENFELFPYKYLVEHLRCIVLSICDRRSDNKFTTKLKLIKDIRENKDVQEALNKYHDITKQEIISSLLRRKKYLLTYTVGRLILIKMGIYAMSKRIKKSI